MSDNPQPEVDPVNLRFLRLLVTVLTGTMIAGLLVIIALIVIRFSADSLPLPEKLLLPDGVEAESFTRGKGWVAVVSNDDRILIYDSKTGQLRQTVEIAKP